MSIQDRYSLDPETVLLNNAIIEHVVPRTISVFSSPGTHTMVVPSYGAQVDFSEFKYFGK